MVWKGLSYCSLRLASPLQVRGSADGVKKALGLVWSQEQQIKDSVVETYLRLFLRPQVRVGGAVCVSLSLFPNLLNLWGNSSLVYLNLIQ